MTNRPRQFRPFEQAREFVHSLGLANQDAWKAYCKSGGRPKDIPSAPHIAYKDVFKGMGDWLGTGNTTKPQIDLPMEEVRRLYKEGIGLRSLAMRYGVGKDTIKRRLIEMEVDTSKPEVDLAQQLERKRKSSREWKARQDEKWQKKEKVRKIKGQKKKRKVFHYDYLKMGALRDIE